MILESEYKARREALSSKLKSRSIGILFGANHQTRTNDTEFPYRQNSHFYYMTGFREDKSALVFVKEKNKVKTFLFVEKKDSQKELWTGKRIGKKEAKKRFSVDKVYEYHQLEGELQKLLKGKTSLSYDFSEDEKKLKFLLTSSKHLYTYNNIAKEIELMRLIKSPSEIALIQKAIDITAKAHHSAMKHSLSLQFEYELQADIEYIFKKNGAYSDAYTSIVACANAANTLHYISNDAELVKGELILIDAGCEYDYYASDITRTIPVNGKFSQAQRELYEMVLEVELKIIKIIRPNILRSDLQKKSEELLCKGMIELGILKGDYKKLMKKNAHKKYYPHGIGHWMGIDVHDQASYRDENGKEIPLKMGMVMTIEPGIYIDENDTQVPKKYRGIGIRIEDDILVTQKSSKNLSQKIAKTIEEIESF